MQKGPLKGCKSNPVHRQNCDSMSWCLSGNKNKIIQKHKLHKPLPNCITRGIPKRKTDEVELNTAKSCTFSS